MAEIVNSWWVLIIIGVCAGIVSGTLGLGSGVILVPTLVLLLGLPQKPAQGVCLAAMVPIVLIGAIRYKMNPSVDVDLMKSLLIGAGGVIGAFIGVELAVRLPSLVLKKIFACFLLIVAVKMLLQKTASKAPVPPEVPPIEQAD